MLLLAMIVAVVGCSSDDSVDASSVSMQIDGGLVNRPAGSTITGLGIVTNYTGGLNWTIKRTYSGNTTVFTTDTGYNLSFTPNKVGEYEIKLTTADGSASAVKMITVYRPISFDVNKIALKIIPQGYTGLFFKINKYTAITGTVSDIYTSAIKNVSTNTLDIAYWNINIPTLYIKDSLAESDQYTIEFYAENTSGVITMVVTKMNIFHNFFSPSETLKYI